MAQRYESNEPEVRGSAKKQIDQLTYAYMETKCGFDLERCTDESGRELLGTMKNQLSTAKHDTVHEDSLVFTSSDPPGVTSEATPPSEHDHVSPESPPAERVGAVLGELGDVLEQQSNALVVPTQATSVPFFLSSPTHVPFAQVIERVDQAINRIVPSQSAVSPGSVLSETGSEPPVAPLPPLESSTFNRIVRELIHVTEGMRMHPGQLAICLYFCYRLGVRLLSQHLASSMGLGNTVRDLMETCAQFLVEQQLIPYVQEHGGWASYIDEWVQPTPLIQDQHVGVGTVIGYVGVALVIGFGLGFLLRSYRP